MVELALDCGFDSQEAFTRAFKRLFGVSPGRFRTGFAVAPLEGQFPMSEPLERSANVLQLPDLVTLPAFRVAGPSRRFDDSSKAQIPQLWSALIGRLPFEGQVGSWAGLPHHVERRSRPPSGEAGHGDDLGSAHSRVGPGGGGRPRFRAL
ncbi:MAG: helix-turn-helix domain-containing protein [Mitsuaria chitosanitabida]|nr:helix-turn-helix domain-containing protein [Roseateles chitosanitabidus]